MSKLYFYIPSLFAKYTRYKGEKGMLAFFFKYFLLVFLASLVHYQNFDFIRLLLAILFMYSLYEFGYIQNDAETIKKEVSPTMRLTNDDLCFYETHKYSIYIIRIIWVIGLFAILLRFNTPLWELCYSLLIIPVFFFYNIIRSKWNLHIHILLMFLRFSVPIFISSLYVDFALSLWVLFIYPLVVFVQLSVKGKFGYKNVFFMKFIMPKYDKHSIHIFRVKYYVTFTIIICVLSIFDIISYWYLLPTIYYSLFTIVSAKKYLK